MRQTDRPDGRQRLGHSDFGPWRFVSDFELRISCFLTVAVLMAWAWISSKRALMNSSSRPSLLAFGDVVAQEVLPAFDLEDRDIVLAA